MRRAPWLVAVVAVVSALLPRPAHAGIKFEEVPGGYASALFVTSFPNDVTRLLVVEQNGVVHVVTQADGKLATPFLDLGDVVNFDHQELGLLGLAFDPQYATNGFFYVDYTRTVVDQIQTVVSRFHISGDPATSNVADLGSQQIKLIVDQPYDNHNGGNLAFGPDGYLYIGFGDGGSAYDPENRSQDLNTYIGKILRVDTSGDGEFTAPPDNPFVGATPGLDLIWAYGVRNPWRFSFDRDTGDLWIADVGQQDTEEVDFQAAGSPGGRNYGWRAYEGNNCNNPDECAPIAGSVTFPIYTYAHLGEGRSITGGYVYRGSAIPSLQGAYLFADFVAGTVGFLRYTPGGNPEVSVTDLTDIFNPIRDICCLTSFGEDANGELYVVSQGRVYKIIDDGLTYLDLKPVATATEPVLLTAPTGDAHRLFILQKNGVIRLMQDGVMAGTPFVDLSDRVASDDELGLLGMAFHPNFNTNGFFYLNYTRRTGVAQDVINTTISRFTATGDPATATSADAASEMQLLSIVQPRGDHNGGSISFSPNDGYLYIPVGDGGCCNDPDHAAQDLGVLNGKILRIDVDHTDIGLNYAIPPDNPYVGTPGARGEIWARGVRNPFRSSFDRATGDFYYGDVGQDNIEKVGFQPATSTGGENYGWSIFEGTRCNAEVATQQDCDSLAPSVTFPLLDYPREFGSSVTGGSVYRGSEISGITGRYFYADYISHRVYSVVQSGGAATDAREFTKDLDPRNDKLEGIVAVSEDGMGELYVVNIVGGIYKIVQGLGDDSEAVGPTEGEGEPPVASGVEIRLAAAADATLYEDPAGQLANGTGRNFFVGRTGDNGGFSKRRSLLYFDVAGLLPPDAQIVSASLRLHCSKVPVGSADTPVGLHRASAAWNEGPTAALGAGGGGALAHRGDVTWIHTVSDCGLWAAPGGDFDATETATQTVGDVGFYTWSGDAVTQDVTNWLADPASNFGWLLLGDESTDKSARRFDSREASNADNRPQLIIRYCGSPRDGWTLNPANNHYYRATESLSYAEAAVQAACVGGYLTTVDDAAENQWLLDNIVATSGTAYIGYSDASAEGTFVWANGAPAGYENWAGGEPNDTTGSDDAVQITAASGQWADISGATSLPGIVERDAMPFLGEGEGAAATSHTADQNGDFVITLSELLRVVQFYNSCSIRCAGNVGNSEDGYLAGGGLDRACAPHSSDYNPNDWVISLNELLRLIQFYNATGYAACPGGEDGFCPS